MITTVQNNHAELEHSYLFGVEGTRTSLRVIGYKNGFATIEPSSGTSIDSFAQIICGCFKPESNFAQELALAYGEVQELKGIEVIFNGLCLGRASAETQADDILARWASM